MLRDIVPTSAAYNQKHQKIGINKVPGYHASIQSSQPAVL